MGIFDKFLSQTPSSSTYAPSNKQAAWVAIVYASAMVDGKVSETEMDAMSKLLMFKEMFLRHEIMNYFHEVLTALQSLSPKEIIDASVKYIPEDEAPTLFCLVTETLIADGIIEADEQEILEYLAQSLQLEKSVASSIIEVMKIRNKGNYHFL